MTAQERVKRALGLRQGEGRTLTVMGGFLLLSTANTTVVSAVKNGLFLSVYPSDLIPHAVIGAALVTAAVAIVFTSYLAGTARRSLATRLTIALAVSVLACRILFALDQRFAFVVYLWLSAIQVLVLTHAWDYAGDVLTGRQAKRLIPLIGGGASLGAIAGGTAVAPAAFALGTANLLWIAIALLLGALPLLWAIPEPARDALEEEKTDHLGAAAAFLVSAGRGFRTISSNRLLTLLALGVAALTLTGTLIDLQLKFVLQDTFPRDRIAAIYGLLSATVGLGTLLLQLWASRVLFPKFGVSFAAVLHSGLLAVAAGGVAVLGGLFTLIVAQAVDDVLQFSLQRPVEQVSLLPFPNRVKSVALATLGGVLRPLSKASAGGIALALGPRSALLPVITVGAAVSALVTYSQHRRRYLFALESAVARHAVELDDVAHQPLVADASALRTIDRALADPDPTIVVFASSLLPQLPVAEGWARLERLLDHPVTEVRAEAASLLHQIETPSEGGASAIVVDRLARERSPVVLVALLESLGSLGTVEPASVTDFLTHDDPAVRRAALAALGKLGWEQTDEYLRVLLASDDSTDRAVGAGAVGDLGAVHLVDRLAEVVWDVRARPAVLESLAAMGPAAVPTMRELVQRRELPLALRRSMVSALAAIRGEEARNALVDMVDEPALGPAALTSLGRMRSAGTIGPVEPRRLRPVLTDEIQRGLRYAAASRAIKSAATGPREAFVAHEVHGLYERSVERVLKVLALSYDPARLSSIAYALQGENFAQKSNALELLDSMMPRGAARSVMPFLEAVTEGLPPTRLDELLENASTVRAWPMDALLHDADWWPRALALHALGRDEEVTTPGRSHDDETIHGETAEEDQMIPLIEKVMILKGSEFFRNFPGSDLAGVAALADVRHVEAGETVFEQGEDGDAFYVVVQGSIKISRGSTHLATLGPKEGFGEMAILDRDTRSATASAAEDTTLLRLDRDSFDRVVEQNPVVARGIYRVLTERLRNTLARVAAG
ncbi:MAG: cyclic nucleotide-binding domain-containing protein [Gemmatimonadales bacterium]